MYVVLVGVDEKIAGRQGDGIIDQLRGDVARLAAGKLDCLRAEEPLVFLAALRRRGSMIAKIRFRYFLCIGNRVKFIAHWFAP